MRGPCGDDDNGIVLVELGMMKRSGSIRGVDDKSNDVTTRKVVAKVVICGAEKIVYEALLMVS